MMMAASNIQPQDHLSDVCRTQVYGRTRELKILNDSLCAVVRNQRRKSTLPASTKNHDTTKKFSESVEHNYDSSSSDALLATDYSHNDNDDDKSTQQIQEQSSDNDQGGRKFVFVSGESGCGKTTLVRSAFQENPCCLFCSGKFEANGGHSSSSPFYALSMCLTELCRNIILCATSYDSKSPKHQQDDHADVGPGDDQHQQQISYASLIGNALDGDEISILSLVIPNIANIFEGDNSVILSQRRSGKSTATAQFTNDDLERLKFVLRRFLVVVSRQSRPVVMFWDDLQWIDVASLALLNSLLNNTELQYFIFVGSYRIDEVDQDHMLIKCIDELPDKPIRIELQNLKVDDIFIMLKTAMRVRDDDGDDRLESVRDLASLLHSRTDGNAFHSLEILDFLQAEQLLEYNRFHFRWVWDLGKIQNQINLSENMVAMVVAKIQRLPTDARRLLQFCALLGFRFDEELVLSVYQKMADDNSKDLDILALLKILVKEGLLDARNGRVKFTHDKVYQAATQLQTDAELSHLMIGKELRKQLDLLAIDSNGVSKNALFACVDQLNMGRALISDDNEKIDLAKLNLAAAKAASRMSAFIPASTYAEIGLKQLDPGRRWSHSYSVTLELTTLLAQLYAVAGDIEKLMTITDEVISYANSIDDKIQAYTALSRTPIVENNFEKSYETSAGILKALGVKIPEKPKRRYAVREFKFLKRKLSSLTDDQLLAFPNMTKKNKLGAMQILGYMTTEQVLSSKKDSAHLDAVISAMLTITLENGLCSESVASFGLFGARLAGSGDIQQAQRFAKLSRMLLDLPGFDTSNRPLVLLGTVLVLHWSESLSSLTDQALAAFKYGIRHGHTTHGFSAVVMYASLYFYSGLPLGPLLEDCKKMVAGLLDYGQKSILLMLYPFQQCAANLLGHSPDILNLNQGQLKSLRASLGWKPGLGGSGEFTEASIRMQIAFYCEEFELARSLMKHVKGNASLVTVALWPDQQRTFFYCLIELHSLKSRKKKNLLGALSHYREARKFYNQMRRWVIDKRSINSAHKLLILDAEMQSWQHSDRKASSKPEHLKQAYDKAIAASTRAGFLQDGALAAHLACRAFHDEESLYWDRAVDLYNKWGARGIVNYIETHKNRVSSERQEDDVCALAGFRGKSRFDASVVNGASKRFVEGTLFEQASFEHSSHSFCPPGAPKA